MTFTNDSKLLRVPNALVTETIINQACRLHKINTAIAFKTAVEDLIANNRIDLLCSYLEPKLKDWIKRGNLHDDRELVIKAIFQVSLSVLPSFFSDTEVSVPIINVRGKKQYTRSGYIDLLEVETKPVSSGAKPKRFVFEFKSKGVNYLELGKF